ncbi:MAG: Mur ligase family protein [Alphaproteobacteria bacterium]|nr:Mur ligase family protein [Alphaproteobacteria bacterium]
MKDMPLWLAEDVVRLVRGRCLHEQAWCATGVSFDGAKVRPGDLFVALQTALYDGHDAVAAAFEAGAVAALVMRRPSHVLSGATLVFVDDTFLALQALARAARQRVQGPVVAVAGSVGKSSVVSMLSLSLGAIGRTYVGDLGLQPRLGVVSALANMPMESNYAFFELPLGREGDLAMASHMLRPDVAVVTSIDVKMLDVFGSVDAQADAQAEVFEGMAPQGTVVLDRDNPYRARLASHARVCGVRSVKTFSVRARAEARALSVALNAESSVVEAKIEGQKISYTLNEPGAACVKDSLAALSVAATVCGKVPECAAALPLWRLPEGCGNTKTIALPSGGTLRLLDASRDAIPASVEATIRSLGQRKADGRKIMVLGDMDSLGLLSPEHHMSLVPLLREQGVDFVFCCGDTVRYLYDALPAAMRGDYTPSSRDLALLVARFVGAGDLVAVQGAESMTMDVVVDALEALGLPHHTRASYM